MLLRMAIWCSGFLAAVLLLTLAVANRHPVRFVLDPFNPANPVISAQLPLYILLFTVLIGGVLLGGIATWLSQGKWRRLIRVRTQDAIRWRAEAERLTRERDARVADRKLSGQRPESQSQSFGPPRPQLASARR